VGDGRLGRHDDDDVPVVAEALVWGGATAPGWEVAHLALDDARIVPAAAALGRHRDDLDQDDLRA
jgi:hypothetical protein